MLVCKVDGKYYCVQSSCPHFGVNLNFGPLIDDKIVCPAHNAQFSVKTGNFDSGPMLNGLQQYEI